MADRVLDADVNRAFASFVMFAQREGMNVAHWALVKPDAMGAYWRLFRVTVRPGEASRRYEETEFPVNLGMSNRDAYATLTAWSQCLSAVRNNRTNIEPGSQIK